MVLKLYGGSGRGSKIVVAAKYNNVTLELPAFAMGTDNKTPEFLKKNPTGKVPVLETEDGSIFESNAIIRYIARLGGKLYGKNAFEQGLVDQWIDFAAHEIELPAAAWLYPIFGYVANNPLATKKAQEDIKKVFGVLDSHLSTRTFFVGNAVTLADVTLFGAVVNLYKTVLDAAFRKDFVNVNRWFNTIANQPNFKAVYGEIALAEKVAVAAAPAKKEKAPKEEKPKAAPKEEKPKAKPAKDDDEEEENDGVEKEEKKPNPLDALPKSTFVLDEWKRQYSNNGTRDVAIPWFWQNLDLTGYSLFFAKYKYNDELKKVFMTSNLIGGFYQRLEKLHKYAFGSMLILGEEPTEGSNGGLEISGVWLFRGPEVPAGMLECDDSEHYDWTPVDTKDEAQKKLVEDYFAWDGQLGGKKFQSGKVFK